MSHIKYKQLNGKQFETGLELWQAFTDMDYHQALALTNRYLAHKKHGEPVMSSWRKAYNTFQYFHRLQKKYGIKKPLKTVKYPEHIDGTAEEIWTNLTDRDYDEVHKLYCEHQRHWKQNEETRIANNLIKVYRKRCNRAGVDYPQKNKCGLPKKPSKDHHWRKLDDEFFRTRQPKKS